MPPCDTAGEVSPPALGEPRTSGWLVRARRTFRTATACRTSVDSRPASSPLRVFSSALTVLTVFLAAGLLLLSRGGSSGGRGASIEFFSSASD